MNERMYHAAARGARFQFEVTPSNWENVYYLPLLPDPFIPVRIHPADSHLQYGVFSSFLVGVNENLVKTRTVSISPLKSYYDFNYVLNCVNFNHTNQYNKMTNGQKVWYLLFLAEFLADQGL